MYLLHTKDRILKEFVGIELPLYAILSHTWDDDEVLFKDVGKRDIENKRGFDKIDRSCKQAMADHFEWIWIDTCCIDKSSSAELSEALNSMYKYYQRSEVCYAFLKDVDGRSTDTDEQMRKSRWFTRGWTLQELIAPRIVKFFGKDWIPLGTKKSLLEILGNTTSIPHVVLRGASPITLTIARRMSWASRRETTREEDMAYCLLGLFDVHLTPLYGEGAYMAFLRLQQEILKTEHDHTIFMWVPGHDIMNQGLLASSPRAFCNHPRCFQWMQDESSFGCKPSLEPYSQIYLRSFSRNHVEFMFGASGIQAPFLIVNQTVGSKPTNDCWVCLEVRIGDYAVALRLERHVRWHMDGGETDYGFRRPYYKSFAPYQAFLAKSPVMKLLKFPEILTSKHLSREVIRVIQPKVPTYVARNVRFKMSVSPSLMQVRPLLSVIDFAGATAGHGRVIDLTEPFEASGGAVIISQCLACGGELGDRTFSIVFSTNGHFPHPWVSWGHHSGIQKTANLASRLIAYYEQLRMCSGEYFDLVGLPQHQDCKVDVHIYISAEKALDRTLHLFHIHLVLGRVGENDRSDISSDVLDNRHAATSSRGYWITTPIYFDFAKGLGDEMNY
jgi:Heterokaryon incompatibility protein (HET)